MPRSKTDNLIKEHEDRLNLALEVGRMGTWDNDLATRLSHWSPSCFRIMGLDPRESTPSFDVWLNCIHPDDRAQVLSEYEAALRDRRECVLRYRILRPDGHVRWLISRGCFSLDELGQPLRSYGACVDITESVEVQETLRNSEQRLQRVLGSINDIFLVLDHDLRVTYANERVSELVPLKREELMGRRLPEILEAEAPFEQNLRDALKGEAPAHFEYYHEKTQRSFETAAYPSPEGLTLLLTETTTRRRAQEALKRSDERLRIAMDAGRIGTWEWDIVQNTLEWSTLLFEMHAADRSKFTGKTADFVQVLAPGEHARIKAMVKRSLKDGADYTIEFKARGPAGSPRWFWTKATVIRDLAGKPLRMVGATMDIDERKRMENDLRQQTELLAEADRRKDDFIAMLAHELRNPLSPIRNAAHLLGKVEALDPRIERFRGMIERQATHMTRMVDDLLDVSRMTRGKILIRREPLELSDLLEEVSTDFQSECERASLEIQTMLPLGDVWIEGDRTRMAQVIGNLLQNSCKFTPRGGRIIARLEARDGFAVLSVQDTGNGIEPLLLASLFEPFRQGGQDIDRKQGGLGLGLAMVKGLVALHKGTVEARSEGAHKGALFVIRIPQIEAPADQTLHSAPAVRPDPRRVLIIEDNADAAETLQLVLSVEGHEVRTSHNVSEAESVLENWIPNVVVCDIGLPEMDGYSLCRMLRQRPALQHCTFIALTGYGQAEDRTRAIEAGFHIHLTKPVEPAVLARAVAGEPLE